MFDFRAIREPVSYVLADVAHNDEPIYGIWLGLPVYLINKFRMTYFGAALTVKRRSSRQRAIRSGRSRRQAPSNKDRPSPRPGCDNFEHERLMGLRGYYPLDEQGELPRNRAYLVPLYVSASGWCEAEKSRRLG